VIEQVARMAVEHALEAGARSVTAAFEARYAKAFAAAGFRERRRYTVMVAATRRAADGEDEMEPTPLNSLYRLRPIQHEDAQALSALLHEAYRDGPNNQERPATSWLMDVAQLLEGSDNRPLGECSFIAELRHGVHTPPKLVGAILVSLWQGAALIDELVVAPRYRQQSVGSALLRRAMLGLREQNYASVMLIVNKDAPTQQFYHHLGFRETRPGYIEAEYSLRQTPLDD
jgi:ribosomal protein S18 acetylase RimI-like enzyme